MMTEKDISEAQSQRIFWVVQTVFAFVLARSFLLHKDCLLSPVADDHWVALLGLVFIYTTALLSWVDYSYSTIVSPYRLGRGTNEKIRFFVDLVIVALYAVLLFFSQELQHAPGKYTPYLFAVTTFIFLLYAASGYLRIQQYGGGASSLALILVYCGVFLLITVGYVFSYRAFGDHSVINNGVFIAAGLLAMLSYRAIRWKVRRGNRWIGIDVDGVIGNQIDGVLTIARDRGGQEYSYNDITEWNLPIGDTNIAEIIYDQQMLSREYILTMPLHPGALDCITELSHNYRLAIVTSRDPATDPLTMQWLRRHRIPFKHYENKTEGKKQDAVVGLELLIDDYPGNVRGFLEKRKHKAILFQQPWNENHGLEEFINAGRLAIVRSWNEVPQTVRQLIGG